MKQLYHPLLRPLELKLQRPLLITQSYATDMYYLDAHPQWLEHQKFWDAIKSKNPYFVWTAQQWGACDIQNCWCPEFSTIPLLLCWAYELFLEVALDVDNVQLLLKVLPPETTTWEQRLLDWSKNGVEPSVVGTN